RDPHHRARHRRRHDVRADQRHRDPGGRTLAGRAAHQRGGGQLRELLRLQERQGRRVQGRRLRGRRDRQHRVPLGGRRRLVDLQLMNLAPGGGGGARGGDRGGRGGGEGRGGV